MKTLRSPRFWIGIAISFLCLWLAFRNLDWSEMQNTLYNARLLWLVPAILIQFLAVWTRARRWAALLDRKGLVTNAFWSHSIGFLFTNVLPFRLGEAARAVVMSERSNIPFFQVAASILVERILDVAIVLIGLAGVLPFIPQIPPLISRAGLTFGAIVVVALIVLAIVVRFRSFGERVLSAFLKRLPFLPANAIMGRWRELVDGLAPLLRWRSAGAAIFWTIAAWACSLSIYWFVMRAFQPDATWIEAIFIIVTLALAISIPSSPGFIGVFQYAGQQALVLPFAGKYSDSTALAITMVAWLVYFVITTLLGMVALWQMGESFSKIGRLISSRASKPGENLAQEE
ncbi:MAG TPA: lysylphosphatidylglycerol synthase transmembrane domain-containing protein [Anaerolineaceae bacterium]|nr:lysylphosphatidylglycerol synthase transmembrane domain-containing protein [Anaerolineaceae bacterium]